MPGLDGIEAARRITADRKVAVLILTAFSQRNLIEDARDAGVSAYLVKPFQRSELVPAIEVALARFEEFRAIEEEHARLSGEVASLEDKLETQPGWWTGPRGSSWTTTAWPRPRPSPSSSSTAMTRRAPMRDDRPGDPRRDPHSLTPACRPHGPGRRHSRAVESAPMADDGPLFLLDGNSLVFRAFFALPIDLATRSGMVTNAVYGFTSMLVNLHPGHEPVRASGWPSTGPSPPSATTWSRTTRATGPRPPTSSSPSSPWSATCCGPSGSPTLEVPGYEADDILATLATAGPRRRPRRGRGDRRPRRLPVGGGPPHQGDVHPQGPLRHRRLRRGRDRRALRGPGVLLRRAGVAAR